MPPIGPDRGGPAVIWWRPPNLCGPVVAGRNLPATAPASRPVVSMAEPAHLVPARDAEAEIVVERSRFLAVVRRVVEEADARAVIEYVHDNPLPAQ